MKTQYDENSKARGSVVGPERFLDQERWKTLYAVAEEEKKKSDCLHKLL